MPKTQSRIPLKIDYCRERQRLSLPGKSEMRSATLLISPLDLKRRASREVPRIHGRDRLLSRTQKSRRGGDYHLYNHVGFVGCL